MNSHLLYLYVLHFDRFGRNSRRVILKPAEVCDLLKGFILIVCSILMCYIDTNMMYHLFKSQSVMKLYIFYNMLEVGDRLFSAFGQDTIDALFWTATEPRDRRREHLGVIPHLLFALVYVCILFILFCIQLSILNISCLHIFLNFWISFSQPFGTISSYNIKCCL